MKILCFAVLIVVAYLVSWSVAYVWLVGTEPPPISWTPL